VLFEPNLDVKADPVAVAMQCSEMMIEIRLVHWQHIRNFCDRNMSSGHVTIGANPRGCLCQFSAMLAQGKYEYFMNILVYMDNYMNF
jgi:hypothetical protein